MVDRASLRRAVEERLRESPIVTLLGPRQCGKTTLAREITASRSATYFDLEDPQSAARLAEPMTSLAPLRGLVVIDEVQHAPALFPVLRVLADRPRTPARFLRGRAIPAGRAHRGASAAAAVGVARRAGVTRPPLHTSSRRPQRALTGTSVP
jgi:hypothetical protein